MTAFDVYLNGRKICTAGVPGTGVLSAHVTWVHRTRVQARVKRSGRMGEQLTMDVGGLITPENEDVRWTDHRALRVGDEVRIKIVEAERVDRPKVRKRSDPAADLRQQKRYVKEMAKRFGWKIQTQE